MVVPGRRQGERPDHVHRQAGASPRGPLHPLRALRQGPERAGARRPALHRAARLGRRLPLAAFRRVPPALRAGAGRQGLSAERLVRAARRRRLRHRHRARDGGVAHRAARRGLAGRLQPREAQRELAQQHEHPALCSKITKIQLSS